MTNPDRRHDLDWLRLIAILILLFYHTGMLFNPWDWHIKNDETSAGFTYWMVWLHYWRMPLLLFISGAGTFLAMRKRSPAQYAGERVRRLVIPLIFGMFVIVPPQIYFEHFQAYPSYASFYTTVFEFVPYPEGSFSWHHLWFIAYLFLYSLIGLPFLLFLRSPKSEKVVTALARYMAHPLGMLLIPSVMLLVSRVILGPYFPEETHALIDDWAYFTFYFLFFAFGILCYSQPGIWNAIARNRNALSWGSILVLIPFYGLYFHFRNLYTLPWSIETIETTFDVMAIFGSWFWVITVIAWGQHLLNRPHPWLRHFNEGLYPFYILLQTVIIAVGFYVCKPSWGIVPKFFVVAFATLALCIFVYFLLIRPFNPVRLFFGMKPRAAIPEKKEAALRPLPADSDRT